MVRIIGVSSGKGGVGKTVTTANLGTLLATTYGKHVVVVDCNLTNPHLGLSLGTMSVWPVTLNDVLKRKANLEQALYTHPTGLKIVPASFEERDLRRLSLARLRSRLRGLFQDVDLVLLDSSPGLTLESMLTLRCSDEVLFVATPHIPSIVDITKTSQVLQRLGTSSLGIVLNRVRGKSYEMGEDEIKKFTNLPVIETVPEDENVLRSTNSKSPVVTMFPRSPASKAFIRLGATLVGETVPHQQEGWFSRLFRRSGK